MLQVQTTVVAVVTTDHQLVSGAAAANVAAISPDPELKTLERSAAAWAQAKKASRTYFVHDADPLADVAGAWVEFFDGNAAHGSIEVMREQALGRWRSGSVFLPDYFLVDGSEAMSATQRHWYFGVLAGAAIHRVVAKDPARSIGDHLRTLGAGPWWPPMDELLDGIEHLVPDRAGTSA
jgi:hypothetical protein